MVSKKWTNSKFRDNITKQKPNPF